MHIVKSPRPSKISTMQTVTVVVLACLAVFASAKPSGHWDDGHWGGHDDGQWHGEGHWAGQYHGDGGHWDGAWDDGHWDGAWDGGHSNVVHGNGATLVGPAVGHSSVVGPSAHGHGWAGAGWAGAGAWGGYGHGGHGVVVAGPHTVPATIVGPSGKVHADGLYGVGHGHGHGGHHW